MISPRASSSKARCTTSPALPVRAEEICGMEPAIEWALSRSRLYALEPIGIGTGLVERLSGYLMRLAEEHAVNTGVLIRELRESGGAARRGGDQLYLAYSGYAMNGMSEGAASWLRIVQAATTRSDLYCLTLLPFRHVLAQSGLFSKKRAWCPICYEEWRVNSKTIYEPLIWTMRNVGYCPVHHRSLRSACPHCGRTLSLLGFYSQPGYCDCCQGWLGTLSFDESLPSASEHERWYLAQLQEILELIPNLDPQEACLLLRRNLNGYVEQVANGHARTMAKHFRCTPRILGGFYSHDTVATLDSILKISLRLNHKSLKPLN